MRLQRLLFTFVVKKWIYLRVYVLLWWLLTGAGEEKCLMERKGGKEEREPEFLVSADLSQRLTWVQTRRHTHAVCVSLLTSSPQMTVYLTWIYKNDHVVKMLSLVVNTTLNDYQCWWIIWCDSGTNVHVLMFYSRAIRRFPSSLSDSPRGYYNRGPNEMNPYLEWTWWFLWFWSSLETFRIITQLKKIYCKGLSVFRHFNALFLDIISLICRYGKKRLLIDDGKNKFQSRTAHFELRRLED